MTPGRQRTADSASVSLEPLRVWLDGRISRGEREVQHGSATRRTLRALYTYRALRLMLDELEGYRSGRTVADW